MSPEPATSTRPKAAKRNIGPKVRRLRVQARWTQAALAGHLHVSQGRLSQLERGEGSFTAEQFLTILELFNVGASHFAESRAGADVELQNVLARLGAGHLVENRILPSQHLEDTTTALRETLVSANAARLVTSLAPVVVRHANAINLEKVDLDLRGVGLAHRLGWLAENTIEAITLSLPAASPANQRLMRRARVLLANYLERRQPGGEDVPAVDLLDTNIRTTATRLEVQGASSEISKRWHVVTAIQPSDFAAALEAALAA